MDERDLVLGLILVGCCALMGLGAWIQETFLDP